MATLQIDLPDRQIAWIEDQVNNGRCASPDEYIFDPFTAMASNSRTHCQKIDVDTPKLRTSSLRKTFLAETDEDPVGIFGDLGPLSASEACSTRSRTRSGIRTSCARFPRRAAQSAFRLGEIEEGRMEQRFPAHIRRRFLKRDCTESYPQAVCSVKYVLESVLRDFEACATY